MQTRETPTLAPLQQTFVEEFLSPTSRRTHLLIAPPGTGKGQCMAEIIMRLSQQKPDASVLILTAPPLVQYWTERIGEQSMTRRTIEGTRRNLREMSTSMPLSEFAWPASATVVLSTASLERFNDLRTSLAQTAWDLIAWDEFTPSPNRLALVRGFSTALNVARLLVLTNQEDLKSLNDFSGFQQTIWNLSLISNATTAGAGPIAHVSISFQRTDAETEIRKRLEDLGTKWRSESSPNSVISPLIQAADSSPLALEQSLRQFLPSRASIAVGDIAPSEQSEQVDPADGVDEYSDQPASRKFESADEIRSLQESLDELSQDSKLEALLRYVGDERFVGAHIMIWCNYVATAEYLKDSLADLNRHVFIITGSSTPRERISTLRIFENDGGFLVATFASMKGSECSADVIVLYDVSPIKAYLALWRTSSRSTTGLPMEIVSLDDGSGKDSVTDLLRQLE